MRALLLAPLLLASAACHPDDPAPTSGDDDDDPTSLVPDDPYRTILPNFALTDADFEGRRLTTAIPDDPRALLFVFHGTNGNVEAVLQTEWIVLYNLLVPNGVGLVLTVALDDEQAQWDHTDDPSNPDFQRLSRIRDQLIATTAVDADTPVLAIGFSHGGGFAPTFTALARDAGWDVRGFAFHQSGTLGRLVVPGFYVSAENDEQGNTPDRVAPLAEECALQLGQDCPHRVGHEIPLDPRRFARLSAYDQDESQAIFDEMVDMGLVDVDGTRLVTFDGSEGAVDTIMDAYVRTSAAPSPTLPPTQLRVVWATHRFSSEHALEEARWLLDRLP